MSGVAEMDAQKVSRLSKPERRRQLIEVALKLLRAEGADRLTLGRLAVQAGVSKPIAYEHFGTRSGLLIALYRAHDEGHTIALANALEGVRDDLGDTADTLARAYVGCLADAGGEWQALGAALSGSDEMETVHRELMDDHVRQFAGALSPHSPLPAVELHRRCAGLVGAGEALGAQMIRGQCTEAEAAAAFAALIRGGVS